MEEGTSKQKVMRVFFKYPSRAHYLMGISREIKLSHTSVNIILKKLIKKHIVTEKIEKRGKRNFPMYYANINEDFKLLKKRSNIQKMEDCGLVKFLSDNLMPQSIILFGSYVRGEDITESDIDIFVESATRNIDISKFEKKLNKKIQLHFKKNINTLPLELKNNIINGIKLYGRIELE
ncbi:nucleotidyltransferase domain-containing protein [archaeon]|jgi:predicted nucleotidyltransferase|nr:nucleotidyltransferase domain-containing protein [archaeon]